MVTTFAAVLLVGDQAGSADLHTSSAHPIRALYCNSHVFSY